MHCRSDQTTSLRYSEERVNIGCSRTYAHYNITKYTHTYTDMQTRLSTFTIQLSAEVSEPRIQ